MQSEELAASPCGAIDFNHGLARMKHGFLVMWSRHDRRIRTATVTERSNRNNRSITLAALMKTHDIDHAVTAESEPRRSRSGRTEQPLDNSRGSDENT
ncbi:MAG: hypothetical protein FWH27_03190 [Planctomycetaceae bacterium]|nr:hypothetical protein [Planctomycetaceae bacterium]